MLKNYFSCGNAAKNVPSIQKGSDSAESAKNTLIKGVVDNAPKIVGQVLDYRHKENEREDAAIYSLNEVGKAEVLKKRIEEKGKTKRTCVYAGCVLLATTAVCYSIYKSKH